MATQSHFRHMAPEAKHFKVRPAKNGTLVLLLLQDDKKRYLLPAKRSAFMEKVGKAYIKAKKQAIIDAKPKYDLKNLPEGITPAELLLALKEKRVLGV